jgi:hypothetical protein
VVFLVFQKFDLEFATLLTHILTVASVPGLCAQRFACSDCSQTVKPGEANLCSLTGHFCCSACHAGDESMVIPSQILCNWDFSLRPVCNHCSLRVRMTAELGFPQVSRRSLQFLRFLWDKPLFRLSSCAPVLLEFIQPLQTAQFVVFHELTFFWANLQYPSFFVVWQFFN